MTMSKPWVLSWPAVAICLAILTGMIPRRSSFNNAILVCSGGVQVSIFTIVTPAENGGASCRYRDGYEDLEPC